MGQQGQIRGQVTDEALKGLLEQVSWRNEAAKRCAGSARSLCPVGGGPRDRLGNAGESPFWRLHDTLCECAVPVLEMPSSYGRVERSVHRRWALSSARRHWLLLRWPDDGDPASSSSAPCSAFLGVRTVATPSSQLGSNASMTPSCPTALPHPSSIPALTPGLLPRASPQARRTQVGARAHHRRRHHRESTSQACSS